jgi:uncharacterized protein YqeY
MYISDQLAADVLAAQKRREQALVDVLRQLRSAFHNAEIANLGPLDDVAVIKFFQQQLKQREESATVFRQASRPELAEKEEAEATIIRSYLPPALSLEQLDEIARVAVAEANNDFGGAMKIAVAKVAGGAAGKEVSAAVRRAMKR